MTEQVPTHHRAPCASRPLLTVAAAVPAAALRPALQAGRSCEPHLARRPLCRRVRLPEILCAEHALQERAEAAAARRADPLL